MRVEKGTLWVCIDKNDPNYNKQCLVISVDNNPDHNGDGGIELLYSNGDTHTGKVRRFMPDITHISHTTTTETLNFMKIFIDAVESLTKTCSELQDKANKLYALECGGVDNWRGYSEALETYYHNEDGE